MNRTSPIRWMSRIHPLMAILLAFALAVGVGQFAAPAALAATATATPTSVVLTSTNGTNPVTITTGTPLKFTATLNPANAIGYVNFVWNTNVMCPKVPVTAGTAPCSYSWSAPGTYYVDARFLTNTLFSGSTSNKITVKVTAASKGQTNTSIAGPSPTCSLSGSSGPACTFTATVTAVAPATGTPIGNVAFHAGSISLGKAALVNGKATFTITASLATTLGLLTGTTAPIYSIGARYEGSSLFLGSSAPAPVKVQLYP